MNGSTGQSPGERGRVRAAAAALCLLAGALTATAAGTSPSAALTPPVSLTADDLTTWQTNGIVWSMAARDGVVYAGGTFSTVRPPEAAPGTAEQPAVNFAAFDAATGAPTGCTLSFTQSSGTATVRALTLSPDGKTLYAGGQFGSVNGVGVSNIAAIDTATCTPRDDFKISVSATVRALAVTADTVYLGGDFNSVGGKTRNKFAAVTTGADLLPFTANADEVARAVEVTPDGRHVLLGGDFFTVNGTSTHALAVVDATSGALTKSYPGFIPNTSTVQDLTTDATGFYTANEGTGGGVFDGRIALDLDDFQQRWRDTCLGATQAVLVHKGVLYSGSHAHDCYSMGEFPDQERKHLLAQSVDDPKLLPWFPDTNDGIGEPVGPRTMSQTDSGGRHYLWVGGEFTTVNGSPQQGLTRFADGPDTGAPWVPNVSLSTVTPGRITVNWQTSFDTDDGELTYRIYKDGASTPVHTTTGYSLFWDRPQLTWADTDVAVGETHSYRITASDGTNTSAKSAAQSATVAAATERYPARVLADGALAVLALRRGRVHLRRRHRRQAEQRLPAQRTRLPADPGRRRRRLHRDRVQRPGRVRVRQHPVRAAHPLLHGDLDQDHHHPGRQDHRVREQDHAEQHHVRQACLHARRRAAGLRRPQRGHPHRHHDRGVQRRQMAPRRRHPGHRRDGALRRRTTARVELPVHRQ
ncbi:hypothetical protein ACVWXU_002686 [Streptomyces sp. TE33382]